MYVWIVLKRNSAPGPIIMGVYDSEEEANKVCRALLLVERDIAKEEILETYRSTVDVKLDLMNRTVVRYCLSRDETKKHIHTTSFSVRPVELNSCLLMRSSLYNFKTNKFSKYLKEVNE